jgi:hypothetical protein
VIKIQAPINIKGIKPLGSSTASRALLSKVYDFPSHSIPKRKLLLVS